ncbi:uncharacterized protein CcaverHIS019_0408670 [Cutaneotrichosporon cavernicola]|uniref:General transcription and DNA repair factor IIH n=1 Tax=Cutaneotrichosporon cavernicola TaxID=279322 RepID=A0AA48L507_9TREE|nr:uncharacterized protein CcaverHIS019_0408670 [Cutaneotrichosporon cavernicola]BEI92047.1 hypothetical protein CcaverHIS019_0408670 [Cutaneotrichosporon cavernicola]BEI99817.1 hypothetical protein CcaverHIS631_0408600 [Cutaneotrichosporon cavernicola]BEJ07593.1 hypothetical protein CcaverHIS641_0408620 [Cutaneotrichosporon cavernicola]
MATDDLYNPGNSPRSEIDSDDDLDRVGPSRRNRNQKSKAKQNVNAWEGTYKRSWDQVQEDETGGLQSTVESLLARGRRKRALQSEAPLRRSLVRHMFIVVDLSESMRDMDFRPDRFQLTLQYLRSFVVEWFDQNPLGQVGVILLRDRLAEMLVPMGGNPQDIVAALADKRKLEPSGEASLQNGLVMARGGMSHLPSTSSLETLVIFSAISTADPDGPINIHQVLDELVQARIRTTVISLSAEIKICKQIAERTGGRFGVAIDEEHYKDLLWETIPPPAQTIAPVTMGVRDALARGGRAAPGGQTRPPPAGDLMVMGFPTRLPPAGESFCACHGLLRRGGYMCPRCGVKLCDVPTDCEVCGLMVVSSPHLARSFWLLFPVAAYKTLPIDGLEELKLDQSCFGCNEPFPSMSSVADAPPPADHTLSPTGRYRCAKCEHDFCIDCDMYVHETLHTCPGCSQ